MEYYAKANRLAHKAYQKAIAENSDPYLPVLAEMVPELDRLQHLSIGVKSILISQIKGTVRTGRSYAFACNFMPLLSQFTEFGAKWETLCANVDQNGVRYPVLAVEYMGYYYLLEGNKRVSVSRFLGSTYIEADIIRYMPQHSDDPKVIAYYESLDFQKDSGLTLLHMTEPGSYHRIAELCGYEMGQKWSEDDTIDIRALYQKFYVAYSQEMPERYVDVVLAGDAFLTYLKAYGFELARKKTSDEVLADVRLMRSEILRKKTGVVVRLELDKHTSSPTLLSNIFGPNKVKAAFLFTRSPDESGWNYWHELGRLNVQDALGDKIETTVREIPSRTAFEEEIDKLIADNHRIIFATSPVMLNSCIRPSLHHSDVKLLCCSLLSDYHHVPSYYLRLYEAKFLMGLVAGIMSTNGKIGYIADYPIHGAPSAINAFAIGARMTNPAAKVYLRWSTQIGFDAEKPFDDEEIQIISNRDINAPRQTSQEYGLYGVHNGVIQNYAIPILNWSVFYRNAAEKLLNGAFHESGPGNSALSFWWGLSSGALDVVFSNRIDPYLLRLVERFKQMLINESFSPFSDEIRDTNGKIRCKNGQTLTPAEILCMDYLVENVVGELPDWWELNEQARPIVKLQGLQGELKPDPSSFVWKHENE